MTPSAGIRQYGLAGELHMGPGRLSDIESGRHQELPEPLQRILEAVGATENGETGP
jgi:transcriptional regulator with XRE-family HTH domain